MTPLIYLGINGCVLALHRDSGQLKWQRDLGGSDFVHVVLDGDRILATTRGEIFCLRAADGLPMWHNKLKGFGHGLISVATPGAPAAGLEPAAEHRHRQEQTAAHAALTANMLNNA